MAAKTTTAPGSAKAPAKSAAKAGSTKQPEAAAAPAGKAARPSATTAAVKTESKSAAPVKATASPVITLKHLAAGLSERHDLPRKQAETMLAELFGNVVGHLKEGERVRIGGLGIIEVKNRPARMGRNPATGEAIQIKASKKVAFRAAKELKDAI